MVVVDKADASQVQIRIGGVDIHPGDFVLGDVDGVLILPADLPLLTREDVLALIERSSNPPVVVKYVNGIKQDDWTTGQNLDNPRRALQPTATLAHVLTADEKLMLCVVHQLLREKKLDAAKADFESLLSSIAKE